MDFKKTQVGYAGRNTYRTNEKYTSVAGGISYSTQGGTAGKDMSPTAQAEAETVSNDIATTTAVNYSFAGETREDDIPGHWTAYVGGVTNISDGLTIKLRLTTDCFQNDEQYNTLSINGRHPELIWISKDSILMDECKSGDEVIFTYRQDIGEYVIPPSSGELEAGTHTSGWIAGKLSFASGSGDGSNIVCMSINAYNALPIKDPNTFYIII